MSYTIKAAEIKPGMTITDKSVGITRTLTVATIEREENWVTLWTAERGIACIRPDALVTVEGEPPLSSLPVGTVLNVPGIGAIVKVREDGEKPWVVVGKDDAIRPALVNAWLGVEVVYIPEHGEDSPRVPDSVESGEDWERDNTEWRKHKWEDEDGDVWEWDENHSVWYVASSYGVRQYTSGPGLGTASFPLTRVK